MNYKEIPLHGFERRDTVNISTDFQVDVEGWATQLNMVITEDGILAIPYSGGIRLGDVAYMVQNDIDMAALCKWYREEIAGIPDPLPVEPEPELTPEEFEDIHGVKGFPNED